MAQSLSAREFAFRYFDWTTIVDEPDLQQHTFVGNKAGTAVGYRNNRGIEWQLDLDERPPPVERGRRNADYRWYCAAERVEALTHPDGRWRFHYYAAGRFTCAGGTPPRGHQAFTATCADGDRVVVNYANRPLSYTLNHQAQLINVAYDGLSDELTYDSQGQLRDATLEHGHPRRAKQRGACRNHGFSTAHPG